MGAEKKGKESMIRIGIAGIGYIAEEYIKLKSREFPGTNRLEISGSKGQVILENDTHMVYRKLVTD